MVGKVFKAGFGGANWTRGGQLGSEVAVGVSWAAGLIPAHTPPGTDQQGRREQHRELSTLLLFQPAWHLAQISPEVLLLLGTSEENRSKGNRINPAPLARESCKSCEKVFYQQGDWGQKVEQVMLAHGCSKNRFSSHSLSSCKATSQLMHKMLISGQGPGKSSLEFSKERKPGISCVEEPDGQ